MSDFDRQVQRNLLGIDLEKAGSVDEAVALYEQNVTESFEGSHPCSVSEKHGKGD